MVSIVIRNKNESKSLAITLSILTKVYADDFEEIIVVDNNSTDNSVEIAKKYNCKIIMIDNFTYGRAINYGIEQAVSKYILLLSSHSVPIGGSFFKNTLLELKKSDKIAGVRFINSIENYQRAIESDFKVVDYTNYGLLAACCIINKEVWRNNKFDEELIAVEDKEWTMRVSAQGYEILDLNETFFYFINRDMKGFLKKYKIETISSYKLTNKKPFGLTKIVGSFCYRILVKNTQKYFNLIGEEIDVLKTNLEIRNKLKRK